MSHVLCKGTKISGIVLKKLYHVFQLPLFDNGDRLSVPEVGSLNLCTGGRQEIGIVNSCML